MSSIEQNECPICYEEIQNDKNCVTTECGHKFHCNCLMKNSSVNGFTCPMCRQLMAEEAEDDYEYEEDEEDEEETIGDDALTSFRMFNQRLDGEEIEDDEDADEAAVDDSDEEVEVEEEIIKPSAEFITAKLLERGFSMEDLVKTLLIDHDEYDLDDEPDRTGDRIFGSFRAIISRYQHDNRPPNVVNVV